MLSGVLKTLHNLDRFPWRANLLARVGLGYFRTLVLKQHALRTVELSITHECQSKCAYCYAAKFKQHDNALLSLNEWRHAWEQAQSLGAVSAMVFGGEPTLHPQFWDILRMLKPSQNMIAVTTNCIELNEDDILEFKKMGLFCLNVSLNSLDPELNDSLRGYKGHFAKTMQVIEWGKKHNLPMAIPIATYPEHMDETERLVEYAKTNEITATILLMCPMGRNEGNVEVLFDESFEARLRKLYDANPWLRGDYDINYTLKVECPAGYEKIHIGPYGDVTGCSMNPVSFGNVRQQLLKVILKKMRSFRHFNKRSSKCLIALDREYIDDYMNFASSFPSSPYPVELNPHLESDCLHGG